MTCNVDRVRDEYDLYLLDKKLRYRISRGDSVGEVTDWLNALVVCRAMEMAGMTVLGGEQENYRRLLADEDVMDRARQCARTELGDAGVDVDRLLSNFLSEEDVRMHIRDCLKQSGDG